MIVFEDIVNHISTFARPTFRKGVCDNKRRILKNKKVWKNLMLP